jgi:RNA polymerase sigma factor (sigma-70 family)
MDDWPDERLLQTTTRAPEAFDVFYRRHEAAVLGYFMRRSRNPELTADLTAETFAAALIGVKRFNERDGSALAWLFGIARHRWLRSIERGRVEDRARRKLGMPPLVLDDDLLDRISAMGGDQRVADLLAHLPGEQATAIEERIIDERSYAEIATRVGCSEAVIRKRVSRGLNTLRSVSRGQA